MNYHKGFAPMLLLTVVAVLLGSAYAYMKNKPLPSTQDSTMQDKSALTVTYPNGGETLRSADLFYAGDVSFKWTTSKKESYTPSANLRIYTVDAANTTIEYNYSGVTRPTHIGNGIFAIRYAGGSSLQKNKKFKIKICDFIDSREYCDTSNDYFFVDSSIDNVKE